MSTTQKSVCRPYIFLVSQTLSFTRSTCLVVCSWSNYTPRSASSPYIDWSCILDSPCKRIQRATHCWYTMMTGHLWTTYKAVEKRVSLSKWVGIPCFAWNEGLRRRDDQQTQRQIQLKLWHIIWYMILMAIN